MQKCVYVSDHWSSLISGFSGRFRLNQEPHNCKNKKEKQFLSLVTLDLLIQNQFFNLRKLQVLKFGLSQKSVLRLFGSVSDVFVFDIWSQSWTHTNLSQCLSHRTGLKLSANFELHRFDAQIGKTNSIYFFF